MEEIQAPEPMQRDINLTTSDCKKMPEQRPVFLLWRHFYQTLLAFIITREVAENVKDLTDTNGMPSSLLVLELPLL